MFLAKKIVAKKKKEKAGRKKLHDQLHQVGEIER